MKTPLVITTALAATLTAAITLADDDCHDPAADWQTRDVLRQQVDARGWEVHGIKIDDGCYEVKGFDQDGNRIEGEFAPASLRLRKLETEYDYNDEENDSFDNDDDDSREDTRRRTESRPTSNSGIVSDKRSVSID